MPLKTNEHFAGPRNAKLLIQNAMLLQDYAKSLEQAEADAKVAAHANLKTNPHAVTAAQVGAYTKAEADTLTPPGTVMFFVNAAAPAGWLKANGATLSRTTYARLFAAIGTRFGVGDGSSTFKIPDLRGEFLRAFDDGRNVDSARAFGALQSDAIRNITADWGGTGNYEINPLWKNIDGGSASVTGAFAWGPMKNTYVFSNSGGLYSSARLRFDASLVVPTAAENRPRNIALLACIKF